MIQFIEKYLHRFNLTHGTSTKQVVTTVITLLVLLILPLTVILVSHRTGFVGRAATIGILEPENGILSGNVTVTIDSLASNGKYIVLNAQIPPTPTPTTPPASTPTPIPPTPTLTPTPTPSGSGGIPPNCSGSLQSLVTAAPSGGTITLTQNCVYRETITVNKSLTIDGGGKAQIRGSNVVSGWSVSGSNWSHGGLPVLRLDYNSNNCAQNGRCAWREQVFVDGAPQYQVASAPSSGQFSVDRASGTYTIGGRSDSPTAHTIEVTYRDRWVVAQADGVTIKGFTMKHASIDAVDGGITNREYNNWTIQNNTLSDAHGGVVSMQSGSNIKVLNNDIARAGDVGINGNNNRGVNPQNNLIQGNTIHDNNTEAFEQGWEAGGVKLALVTTSTWDSNTVYNSGGPGLWCDISCKNITISNNRVYNNKGVSSSGASPGIFFEISDGAKIFGNKTWNNGWSKPDWGYGAGILVSSSGHTEVYNNIVAWNADGIALLSQNRGDLSTNGHGIYVHDNQIISEGNGPTFLGWLQDWASPLFTDTSNQGLNNSFWFVAGQSQKYEWSGVISDINVFKNTRGGQGSTLMSDSTKNTTLSNAGIPTSPPAH